VGAGRVTAPATGWSLAKGAMATLRRSRSWKRWKQPRRT
jgi:hypothetical protein